MSFCVELRVQNIFQEFDKFMMNQGMYVRTEGYGALLSLPMPE